MTKRLIALLLLVPGLTFAACRNADVIDALRPGEGYSITNDDPATIVWNGTLPAPTLSEIQAARTTCLQALTPAGILATQRAVAIDDLNTDPQPASKLQRAVFLVTLDEINLIRSFLVPAQPQRTIAQFKNAVQTKINSGAAD